MPFQVGDQIVLSAHGVGQIVGLEERQFQGNEPSWYYVVSTAKSTIWVSMETYEAAGLRRVAADQDLAECSRILSSSPNALDSNHFQRRLEIANRLRNASLQIICEVVRDLTALGWKRSLAEADSALLRRSREHLCEEWAAARGFSPTEATQEIEALLQAGRQTSQS